MDVAFILLHRGDETMPPPAAIAPPRAALLMKVGAGALEAFCTNPLVIAFLADGVPIVAALADLDEARELARRVARVALRGPEALLEPTRPSERDPDPDDCNVITGSAARPSRH